MWPAAPVCRGTRRRGLQFGQKAAPAARFLPAFEPRVELADRRTARAGGALASLATVSHNFRYREAPGRPAGGRPSDDGAPADNTGAAKASQLRLTPPRADPVLTALSLLFLPPTWSSPVPPSCSTCLPTRCRARRLRSPSAHGPTCRSPRCQRRTDGPWACRLPRSGDNRRCWQPRLALMQSTGSCES